MKHFDLKGKEGIFDKLFYKKPEEFDKNSDKNFLKHALGGTLYMPATRDDLLEDIYKMKNKGASSLVICLEDSIADDELQQAEENLHKLLKDLVNVDETELPLLFIRPRTPNHYNKIAEKNGSLLSSLTGIVYPKFDKGNNARDFIALHKYINKKYSLNLYYMPVIESEEVIKRDTRTSTLNKINYYMDDKTLLAVRIGATDMSSVYGLRRNSDFTIYDNHVVSSAIADIVNALGCSEYNRVITGAVWEHFRPTDRTFKPLLRQTIFRGDTELRNKLLLGGYDSFIREVQLDKINGILGKTIIHPSHIALIHSLLVVGHEEYEDAKVILGNSNGGAYASPYNNKMNEVKPHYAWAKKIETQARAFGVANSDVDFVDFMEGFEI